MLGFLEINMSHYWINIKLSVFVWSLQFSKQDDVKSKHYGFLETHTNSRTNCDHIFVKNGDYVKYGFIPKWKKILSRVGFEPAMLRMGWDLKQKPTKWIWCSTTELSSQGKGEGF